MGRMPQKVEQLPCPKSLFSTSAFELLRRCSYEPCKALMIPLADPSCCTLNAGHCNTKIPDRRIVLNPMNQDERSIISIKNMPWRHAKPRTTEWEPHPLRINVSLAARHCSSILSENSFVSSLNPEIHVAQRIYTWR